jgi:hypothetical protein
MAADLAKQSDVPVQLWRWSKELFRYSTSPHTNCGPFSVAQVCLQEKQ